MTSREDRKMILEAVAEAHKGGARLVKISEIIGVDCKTLRRWSAAEALNHGGVLGIFPPKKTKIAVSRA